MHWLEMKPFLFWETLHLPRGQSSRASTGINLSPSPWNTKQTANSLGFQLPLLALLLLLLLGGPGVVAGPGRVPAAVCVQGRRTPYRPALEHPELSGPPLAQRLALPQRGEQRR